MKRLFAGLGLMAAMLALSGCYIDPGYSYVRQSGYQGDAYYGHGVRTYDDGYYAAPVYGGYYGPGYGYGYAPGISLGVTSVWYGGSYYRDGRGYRGRGYGYRGGPWRGYGSDLRPHGDYQRGQRVYRQEQGDDRRQQGGYRQGERIDRPRQGTHRDSGRRSDNRTPARRVDR